MSAAGPGRPSRSASMVVVKPANGFHLLRIDGYSQTKTLLPGQKLSSQQFVVGGHSWRIDYYPSGRDASANQGAISVYLQLIDHHHQKQRLQARYKFSLLDHDGIAAYELPAEMGSFAGVSDQLGRYPHGNFAATGTYGSAAEEEPGPGCGHEEFIVKEDLETREHLIRDDSIVVRCDVGVTEIEDSFLAQDELNMWEDGEESEEDGYEAPMAYGAPARRRRSKRRRVDDGEYVKWCLAQQPVRHGGRR